MSGKKSFPLRIDPKLYEILERWAADEFRSVNAHLEYLLRDAAYRAGRMAGGRPQQAAPPPASPSAPPEE
ncbi:hypothetical protein [Paenibacillus sp. GYB003]|uniref:hypothetical protein n=1 Tax=Paenibacillus sp. GYB003 TaxID=2994392 RepID=UPI002F96B6B7